VIGGDVEIVQGDGLRATGEEEGLVEVGDMTPSRSSKAGNPPVDGYAPI
jgi:hypothetical protein